jgi:hypothetical protein
MNKCRNCETSVAPYDGNRSGFAHFTKRDTLCYAGHRSDGNICCDPAPESEPVAISIEERLSRDPWEPMNFEPTDDRQSRYRSEASPNAVVRVPRLWAWPGARSDQDHTKRSRESGPLAGDESLHEMLEVTDPRTNCWPRSGAGRCRYVDAGSATAAARGNAEVSDLGHESKSDVAHPPMGAPLEGRNGSRRVRSSSGAPGKGDPRSEFLD